MSTHRMKKPHPITLSPREAATLAVYARNRHGGNKSVAVGDMLIRQLIAGDGVTESEVQAELAAMRDASEEKPKRKAGGGTARKGQHAERRRSYHRGDFEGSANN